MNTVGQIYFLEIYLISAKIGFVHEKVIIVPFFSGF